LVDIQIPQIDSSVIVATAKLSGDGSSIYQCRVYYEDTDCLGMVYHANYLKYVERARTHHIEAIARQSLLDLNKDGSLFVVRRMTLKFMRPARLGDFLNVITVPLDYDATGGYGANSVYTRNLEQRIKCDGKTLFKATVELACIDGTGKAIAWPDGVSLKPSHRDAPL